VCACVCVCVCACVCVTHLPPSLPPCSCSNRTAVWQPLTLDPETLSVRTNVSYNSSLMVSQVRSQVTFHKPQQVTLRCQAANQGGRDKRDIKLVSSSKCPNQSINQSVNQSVNQSIAIFKCCTTQYSCPTNVCIIADYRITTHTIDHYSLTFTFRAFGRCVHPKRFTNSTFVEGEAAIYHCGA